MVHSCNINCYSMDDGKAERLGVKDEGKWLPFIFDINIVDAIKLTTDDIEESTYDCTSVYTDKGDIYIIDTPFKKFSEIFKEYKAMVDPFIEDDFTDDDDDEREDDLNL